MLGKALERRRSLFGEDSAETGGNLVALGMLRLEQGKMEDAERLVRDGLAMARRHLPADDPQIGRAITSRPVFATSATCTFTLAILIPRARCFSVHSR